MSITRFNSITIPKGGSQRLKINKSKRKIDCTLRVYTVDDGKFKVVYIPAFDLTAYGRNRNEAREMLKEVVNDYFDSLIDLTLYDMRTHLVGLGWSTGIFRKQFENFKEFDKKGICIHL